MIIVLVEFTPYRVLIALLSIGLCAGATYYRVEMQRKRSSIQTLSGSLFQDNDWGLAQVLALFVWCPLLTQVLRILVGDIKLNSDTWGLLPTHAA